MHAAVLHRNTCSTMRRSLRARVVRKKLVTTTYAYDNNGNLSTVSNGSATTTYTYDYANRLIALFAGGATTSYAYGAFGNRVSQSTATTTFRYPNKFFSVASSTGTGAKYATTTEYIFNNDSLVATIDQKLVSGTATATITRYNHTDNLGSTNVTSDSTMSVAQWFDYGPYGSLIASTNTGSTTAARGYIGEFTDQSTLSYLNARYYNSGQGQFTSQDPMFLGDPKGQMLIDPQSLNSYSYAGDNPITKSDPTGKFWWKEFYTDWNGYSGVSGLAMKAGEVFGGRFAAQDAIAANFGNIANSSAQTGVSPAVYQAIMYEENAHQLPPGERMIENACPQCVGGGIGVMQVSGGTSKLSNKALLNDRANVNAAGSILQGIQSTYGSSPSILGAYYNSGTYGPTNAHAGNYGQRVNSYAKTNLSPTFADGVVRTTAGVVTGSASSILSSLFAVLTTLSSVLKSMSK
jgi:RHS repeat-associated protein